METNSECVDIQFENASIADDSGIENGDNTDSVNDHDALTPTLTWQPTSRNIHGQGQNN